MAPDWSRREMLRAVPLAVAGSVAGCGGTSGGSTDTPILTGTPGKDAGTDAYGIVAYNETDTDRPMTVTVELVWEEKTPLSEELTLSPGEAKEWNHVITTEKEYVVKGSLPPEGNKNVEKTPETSSNFFVTPGSEDAPDVENIGLIVRNFDTKDGGETTLLTVTADPKEVPG